MIEKKFDPQKLQKLNDPQRIVDIPPRFIWDKINVADPKVAVDIGAGTGVFSKAFLQYSPKAKIFACDLSDIMIQWMKAHVCQQYPQIVPLRMEETVVPLEDGVADVLYMINVHHELDEPQAILKESLRVLRSGGVLCIVDWKKQAMPKGPPLEIRCSVSEVEGQIAKAGFRKVCISQDIPTHFLIVAHKPA